HMQCTIHHVPYTIYHVPYTKYHVPYTIYIIPHTINQTRYEIYDTRYTIYDIPYTLCHIYTIDGGTLPMRKGRGMTSTSDTRNTAREANPAPTRSPGVVVRVYGLGFSV
ncbi:hypothetical protein T484DRAFT_1618875, partial [Baffinella frigidus]